MRRSCAPSYRKNLSSTNVKPNEKKVILQNSDTNCASNGIKNDGCISVNNKLIFNVVWAKPSTKKHKTWEGDGVVEVMGNMIVLKDLDGKIMGSSISSKANELVEGTIMSIGSKEVELLEKVSIIESKPESNENVPIKEIQGYVPSFKKPKVELKEFKQPDSVHREIITELDSNYIPFILPKPSIEHQEKFNPSKRPIKDVSVIPSLTKCLREHQREGVKFMYECLMGFRSPGTEYCGVILADEMGLGKTLQCITVCYTLLKQGPYGNNIANKILILTPSSLVENWNKEITKWLRDERVFTSTIDAKHKAKLFAGSTHIPFLIISYETLVKQFNEIETIPFDVIVCDEGHRLKNNNIKVAQLITNFDCKRRILLTGTPIQNDLQEFYSLINFVNPGMFGTYQEYKSKYEIPIIQSQQPMVLPCYRELGESRAKELNEITKLFILRRTQDVINKYLPSKQELVIFCKPSELQQFMIEKVLEFYESQQSSQNEANPLQIINILKKICNHPSLIQNENASCSLVKYLDEYLPSWQNMGPFDSTKLSLVQNLLAELIKENEKIILVSYFTKTLDMLMDMCDYFNYKYCRLDGTTASSDRSKIVDDFNNPESDIFVFLLSAKAGGAGLNLIGASRLVLYDNDWNPATDLQAMSRIWRDGQSKDVFIYRLITAGTIEEKIFQRQISKSSLSGFVIDQDIKNSKNLKFSNEELKDLFSIQENYDVCLTHSMLKCNCDGNGIIQQKYLNNKAAFNGENSFEINISKKGDAMQSIRMDELMRWEHYQLPSNNQILEDICLKESIDNLLFIFRNKIDLS